MIPEGIDLFAYLSFLTASYLEVHQFISDLAARNVIIRVSGDKVIITDEHKIIDSEMLAFLKDHKPEVIEFLKAQDQKTKITPAPPKPHYDLSSVQKRLFFLYQWNPDTLAYNLPEVLHLKGHVDVAYLTAIFRKLIDRHEILRTSFYLVDDEPVQCVAQEYDFEIEQYKSSKEDLAEFLPTLTRPFDLSVPVQFRASLVRLTDTEEPEGECVLATDMHHIVTDGVSQHILVQEFNQLYRGEGLPPIKLHYKDFVEWQSEHQLAEQHRTFWLNEFSEEVNVLDLPTDFERPAFKGFDGFNISFYFEEPELKALRNMAKTHGLTMNAVFLAAFKVFLSKLSGAEDIVVGTPVAGRQHVETERMIGMFVNTLAIRNVLNPDESFREFARRVHDKVLACLDHQQFLYDDLIDALRLERDRSRNPLFDVNFAFQNFEKPDMEVQGLELSSMEMSHEFSKFDLTLTVQEYPDYIYCDFQYATELFAESTIHRFIKYFKHTIRTLSFDPDIRLSEINLLSQEDKERLLIGYNATDGEPSGFDSVLQLIEERACKFPEKPALRSGTASMSYGELWQHAETIAAYLIQEKGILPGDFIAIMLPREMDFVPVVLGVLKAGAVYIPLDPNYPRKHIQSVLSDCQPALIVTNQLDIADDCVSPGEMKTSSSKEMMKYPVIDENSLAYLIYTSGSTGPPKGVMIKHHSLSNYLSWAVDTYAPKHEFQMPLFTSLAFDLTITSMFLPLITGNEVIIYDGMEQAALLEKVLEENQCQLIKLTPSHLRILCAQRALNNSIGTQITTIIVGGEELSRELANQVYELYGDEVRIYNEYGPTEATIGCMIHLFDPEETTHHTVPIGCPIENTEIYLLDKYQNPVVPGQRGEIYIAGIGLAAGYLGNREKTDQVFVNNPFQPGTKMYRSGDFARFLNDGDQLLYLGREKDWIKLNGYRISPEWIGSSLQKYKGISEAMIVTKEQENQKLLVGYYVSASELQSSELRKFMLDTIPEHMVPSHFVHLEEFPLSPNGKIDKTALPAVYPTKEHRYVAPSNHLEKQLVDIWESVLNLEKLWGDALNHGKISVTDNYTALGGDSIKSITLVSRINKVLGTQIKTSDLFSHQTVRELAYFILEKSEDIGDELIEEVLQYLDHVRDHVLSEAGLCDRDKIEDIFPLSDIQKGMIFYSLKEQGVYHDQMIKTIAVEDFDAVRFEKSLELMSKKHPILRTGFLLDYDQEYLQVVYDSVNIDYDHQDISMRKPDDQYQFIQAEMLRDKEEPFDLKKGGLWRYKTYLLDDQHLGVCFIFHHAIMDGWSEAAFNTELNNTYLYLQNDDTYQLQPLKSSYRDYVVQQLKAKRNLSLKQFWENELQDYSRYTFGEVEEENTYKSLNEQLPQEWVAGLKNFAKEHEVSMKAVFHAAFLYGLNAFSYGNDLTVGLITNNRPVTEDGEKILGCFLNTVPFRMQVPEKVNWKEWILAVQYKLNTLKKYEESSLIDILELTGESGEESNPLSDIIFNFVDFHVYDDLAEVEPIASKNEQAAVDLDGIGFAKSNTRFGMTVDATGETLTCVFNYETSFVSERLVHEFYKSYKKILQLILTEAGTKHACSHILSPEGFESILRANTSEVQYEWTTDITQLIEEQVKRAPQKTAVLFGALTLTYEELNAKANRLARDLQQRGVEKSTLVPLVMSRGIDYLVAFLAVNKIGACNVPISRYWPHARIEQVVETLKTPVVLVDELSGKSLQEDWTLSTALIKVDQLRLELDHTNLGNEPDLEASYVMFHTSGTTGTPKGVLLNQKGIYNRFMWMNDYFGKAAAQCVLRTTKHIFDSSLWQLLWPLINGGKTIIPEESRPFDLAYFTELITQHEITMTDFVPALFNELVLEMKASTHEKDFDSLKEIVIGGDAISVQAVNEFTVKYPNIRLTNLYGPTEASIGCIFYPIENRQYASIPIGKPIANMQVHILSRSGEELPVGAKGELYLSGVGLATAYYRQPELTEEKFVTNDSVMNTRMYKTGDMAQWLPDGCIEFHGRVDDQVKIRGFRIELGEIEFHLSQHKKVNETCVITRGEGADKLLVAYYVSDESIPPKDLERFLADRIPSYMVPTQFVYLEKLPRAASGKVNKKNLPEPILEVSEQVALEGKTEERLLALWAEVLKLKTRQISVLDNFFKLGGNSLRVVTVINRIKREFGIDIPLKMFFEMPVIRDLARFIDAIEQNQQIAEKDTEEVLF